MAVPAECERAVAAAIREWGPIDVLINNVGNREENIPIAAEPLETWQRLVDLNLTSCFIGTRLAASPAMLERGKGGRIIDIASISALIANRGIGGRHYETAKAAVLHFTRCAAADWAPHGITVNAICPGLFMTDANKEWNRTRPDVIQAIVRQHPHGAHRRTRGDRTARGLSGQPRCRLRDRGRLFIDGGYTLW